MSNKIQYPFCSRNSCPEDKQQKQTCKKLKILKIKYHQLPQDFFKSSLPADYFDNLEYFKNQSSHFKK